MSPVAGVPATIDAPGTVCAFEAHGCSHAILGHGGFDVHHRYPKSMGGAEVQGDMLTLCPNHHRRQHALIRWLVENDGADPTAKRKVVIAYTPAERAAATFAVSQWRLNGSPPISGWECPAAR